MNYKVMTTIVVLVMVVFENIWWFSLAMF